MRATIRDIAKAAGVSHTTVGRALNNRLRISSDTRAKILAIAKNMAYQPDPIISAAARNRWQRSFPTPSFSMAFVTTYPTASWSNPLTFLRQESEKRGYRMDSHVTLDYPSLDRLSKTLYSRGVRGLILAFHAPASPSADFNVERFSAVTFGIPPFSPPLHRIQHDVFHSTLLAWQKVIEAGYRRIGITLLLHQPKVLDDTERVAAVSYAQTLYLSPSECIPVFSYRSRYDTDFLKNYEAFTEWFVKYQPEVVIGFNPGVAWWLKEMGKRIPEDVAFVNLHAEDSNFAGMVLDNSLHAKTAIQFLDMLIRNNERGLPAEVQTISLMQKWQPGPSLPQRVIPNAETNSS